MKFKKDEKGDVEPIVAVIIMTAITVLLAVILYVWVASIADEEGEEEPIEEWYTVTDKKSVKLNSGSTSYSLILNGNKEIGATEEQWKGIAVGNKIQLNDNDLIINIKS